MAATPCSSSVRIGSIASPSTDMCSWSPRRMVCTSRLHVSAEWFAPVDSFPIFDPAPFPVQPSGDTLRAGFAYALDAVINVGVGVEHAFASWLSGFASFQTNFSARPSTAAPVLTLGSWDAYYVTAGTAFRFQGSDVTLGLGYGAGADEFSYRPGDPPDPIQEVGLNKFNPPQH